MKKIALFFLIGLYFKTVNSQQLRALVRPDNLF